MDIGARANVNVMAQLTRREQAALNDLLNDLLDIRGDIKSGEIDKALTTLETIIAGLIGYDDDTEEGTK